MSSRCLECGPMSLTSVITNMSLSIPIIYSLAVFGEVPTPLRVAGLVLMIATFVISALGKTGNGNGRVSTVWTVCVIIAFFANGITAVLQKQNAMHKGDNTSFLALAYFVAFVCFFGIFLVENKGQRFKWSENFKCGAAVVPITFLAGIGSFVGNGLLGSLSTRVDATILYPCINGGLALMSSAVSFLFFKEKFSAVKALSMAVGISAIILLTV